MIGLIVINISIKLELGDKKEEVFIRATQINLQQLTILARSLDFTHEEVVITGIKSGLLKMVIRKLSSEDFDTPEGKKTLCETHKLLMVAHVKNHINKSLTDSKYFNSLFLFTPLEPSSNSQTFFKLKYFKVDGKIDTPSQKYKVTFASLSYQIPNVKTKGYIETEICKAILKYIS